jgi:hypothetical protein
VTITRLVVLLVGVAALVAAAPSLLDSTSNVRDEVSSFIEEHGGGDGQSAEQISSGEFDAAHGGMKQETLRDLFGSPSRRTTARVEGLDLDCWYYGVAGATGAYQFCFVDGKLSSKRRYAGDSAA